MSDPGLAEAEVTSLNPDLAPPVAITDAVALRALEERGFGFGHYFGAVDLARADALQATPGSASITHGIAVNLDALKAADASLGVGMRFGHRLFDIARTPG